MAPLRGKGPVLVAVMWFEVTLSLIFISLRYYSRTFIGGTVGWDDYLLVVTWVLMAAFAGLCSASATWGMGVHVDELTINDISHGIQFLLIGQSTIAVAMGISKCAVSVFLMRIVVKTWHKVVLWFWIVSIMVLSIFLALAVFLQCTPTASIWDPRVPKDHCSLNLTIIAKILCAWSAAMDFFLAFCPWVILWDLNMKRKEKITICVSLSLGVLAGVCGVIRTAGLDVLNETQDYLYATTDSVIWTNSEMTVTIVCVSIPALRPLYNRVRGLSSSGGGYRNYHQYGKSTAKSDGAFNLDYMGGAPNKSRVEATITDNNSDKEILRGHDNQIHCTEEIIVSSEVSRAPASARQHV